MLKLSDEELPVLATYFGLQGDAEQQLKQLIDKFDLRLIAYTLGLEGSMLATPDQIDIGKATPVEVVDSVGAGDSFTAALVVGMLHGLSLRRCNEIANRVAAFVCSSHGACPELPVELLRIALLRGRVSDPPTAGSTSPKRKRVVHLRNTRNFR